MSIIDPVLLEEMIHEELNLIAKEKDIKRLEEICERRRNRVAAWKHLVDVYRENPIEPNEMESVPCEDVPPKP